MLRSVSPHAKFVPPKGRRETFKLKAVRDFTACIAKARNFDESLRVSLMVILGTFSIVKGALFLEEDGEFRSRVARGLPPGIPPVGSAREIALALRRGRRPINVHRQGVSAPVRRFVHCVERAVPSFSVELFCPVGTPRGIQGVLLLGPRITGEDLSLLQRETLTVMASFLAGHVANHREVSEKTRLNETLRVQVQENERLLKGMHDIYLDSIRAFAAAIEAKDPYTRGHSERVARISVRLGKELGLGEQEVEALNIASILHDVGKIVTDSTILVKPTALTAEENAELQRHPRTSFDILSEIRFPYPDVALITKYHHERVDGTGYPERKRGRQIPVGARIIAVADAFDAMVSSRPYRSSLPLTHALEELRIYRNRHFDSDVVKAFFGLLREDLHGIGADGAILQDLENGYSRAEILGLIDRTLKEIR